MQMRAGGHEVDFEAILEEPEEQTTATPDASQARDDDEILKAMHRAQERKLQEMTVHGG